VLLEEIEAVRLHGVTAAELERAKQQLKARFVFDNDSITNIAHQIGFFETVAKVDIFAELSQRVDKVTLESVAGIAGRMLTPSNRTVGWFDPIGIAPAAPQAVDA
jgi:predicted Zn-dependent peptidase